MAGSLILLSCFSLLAVGSACTYFELPDGDDWVIGRTMELGNFANVNNKWEVVLHPRSEHQQGFISKYGYVSIEAATSPSFDLPSVSFEGINEVGLTVSALSLRTSVYQDVAPNTTELDNLFFVPWVLGTFQNTQDVVTGLHNVSVVSRVLPTSFIGLHWAITDTKGNSIVVEYVKGEMRMHRNDVRVLTNDPTYEWHVTNLDSYVFLSPKWVNDNNENIAVVTEEFGTVPTAPGHGYNLGGLPGDMSPPSRFVRMFYLKQYAMLNQPPKDTDDVLTLATGLINNVYLDAGTIARSGTFDAFESTCYAIMKMPKSGKLYLRSQNNMQWRLIDVKALDFTKRASFYVETGFRAGVQNDTGLLKKHSVGDGQISLSV